MEDYCCTREATLEEEIAKLDISENDKQRIFKKLENERAMYEEKVMNRIHDLEIEREKCTGIREQNISLKNACFALAAALNGKYEL